MNILKPGDVDHELALLGATDAALEVLRRRRSAGISKAREAGATWDQIAEVLGLTRQAVSSKFGRGSARERKSL